MSLTVSSLVNLSESVRHYLGEQNRAQTDVNIVAENFLTAVECGNYAEVKRLLESKSVDVNYEGRRRGVQTTALQIAAERNDFYMVKLLFLKGAKELAVERVLGSGKNIAIKEKIYAYGAISSPAYLIMHYLQLRENEDLSSRCCRSGDVKDCVHEAFELVKSMKEFVRQEKLTVLKDLYETFNGYIQRLEDFPVEILNSCRTPDEVRWFLEGGCHDKCCNCINFETRRRVMSCTCDRDPQHLITMEKAIDTKQKRFISQDQVQRFLKEEWLRGQPKWSRNKGILWRVLFPSSLSSLVFTIFGGDATESLTIEERTVSMMSDGTAALSSPRTVASYFIAVGYILYILFGIIVLIMLLNLCIAMMSDRYSQLYGEIDLEWKFERSRIRMEYIGDRGSNANILSFIVFLLYGCCCCCIPFVFVFVKCCVDSCKKNETHETELRDVKTSETVASAGNENEAAEVMIHGSEELSGLQEEGILCPFPFPELLELLLVRYLEKYAEPPREETSGLQQE